MEALDLKSPLTQLRLGYGLVPIVAGADKFTHLLCDWNQYLSPLAKKVLPHRGRGFMKLVGLVEIGVGALVLTRWGRLGAYAASAWLAGIAVNLLTTGKYFDIAARDALLSLGALTLARLTGEGAVARPGLPRGAGLPRLPDAAEAALELQ